MNSKFQVWTAVWHSQIYREVLEFFWGFFNLRNAHSYRPEYGQHCTLIIGKKRQDQDTASRQNATTIRKMKVTQLSRTKRSQSIVQWQCVCVSGKQLIVASLCSRQCVDARQNFTCTV